MSDFLNQIVDLRDVKYPDVVTKHGNVVAKHGEVVIKHDEVLAAKALIDTAKADIDIKHGEVVAKNDEIKTLSVTSQELPEGEAATALYDVATGTLHFGVPKGSTGLQGIAGIQGETVDHITKTAGSGVAGSIDTYTLYADVAETIALGNFDVYNGTDGSGAGDMTKATYDTTSNGIVDNAEKVNGLTVEKAVPADANFNDTVYDDSTTLKDGDIGIGVQAYNVNILTIKNNLSAVIAPLVTNDNTQGYAVGSRWIDTALGKTYECTDATTGAAVWTEGGGGAGAGTPDATGKNGMELSTRGTNAADAEWSPFRTTPNTISQDYTIPTGVNATIVRPTIEDGVTITIPEGSTLVIL